MIKGLEVLFLLLLCFPVLAAEDPGTSENAGTVSRAEASLREIDAEFENNLKRYLSLNLSDTDYKLPP